MPLIRNETKPLAKSILIPLGLTAAATATSAAIHEKMFESGMTKLTISNKEINDIMKIVKSPQESELLLKDINETVKNETKGQKGGFSEFY